MGRLNSPIIENGSLATYLKEIGKLHPLTSEMEAELAAKINRGCRESLDALVKANLRFVVSVAVNYQNQGLSLCDLINEGNIGLVKAAKRFDGKKNFRFISYAVWWIRQAIMQALAEQSRLMRLPLNRAGAMHKINKTQILLEQRLSRSPDTVEIARELSLTEASVRETMFISNSYSSLDAPSNDDKDSTLMDATPDPSNDDLTHRMAVREESKRVLDKLTDRERDIVKMYYGVDCDGPYTLNEIGRKFKITRERVRQLKLKALQQIKHDHGIKASAKRRRNASQKQASLC